MKPPTDNTLRVPGADLYYQIQGGGPMLFMIAGGSGAGFNGIADHLADRGYTVVTYDLRGNSRSALHDPSEVVRLETHSDDAHRLLAALTKGPAYVFSSSAGALIGLDLAIRYTDQVRMLIAHEPPAEGLLPGFDQFQENFRNTYLHEGPPAFMKYVASLGVRVDNPEAGTGQSRINPREAASIDDFFTHTFMAIHRYRLDIDALRKASAKIRIVLAGGGDGREFYQYLCAAAVAERLGTSVTEFPGRHDGYITHPDAFAERLCDLFRSQAFEGGIEKPAHSS
jgi:pimeloyl-ACP methyl ester carboxylesterase